MSFVWGFGAIHKLDLSFTNYTVENWRACMKQVEHARGLVAVTCNQCMLTTEQLNELVDTLRFRARHIQVLTLGWLDACGNGLWFETLAETQLRCISIHHAPGVGAFLDRFSLKLRQMCELTHIALEHNMIQGHNLRRFASALSAQKQLQCLSLAENPLGRNGVEQIVGILHALPNLRVLNLDRTGVCDATADRISLVVQTHPNIEELHLSGNTSIRTHGWYALATALPYCRKMRVLNLSFTFSYDVCLWAMASALEKNTTLQVFDYTFFGNTSASALEAQACISRALTKNTLRARG